MQKKTNIAIFGLGPASIFFCSRFLKSNITINIFEKGDKDQINKDNKIINSHGPINFFKNGNPEFINSFFGTCALWRKKGVGGKLQKFDKFDINNYNWPINYSELDYYYSEVIDELKKSVSNIDKYKNNKQFSNKFFQQLNSSFDIKISNGVLTANFSKVYDYYKKKLENSKNINIFYNSEISNLNYSFEDKKVESAEVISNSSRLKIQADNFVLSAGCINNNLILIKSFKDNLRYLEQFNIGKNLTFHPSCGIGQIIFKKKLNYNLIKDDIDYKNEQFFIQDYSKDKKLNSALAINLLFDYPKTKLSKLLFKFSKKIIGINLNLIFEHIPNLKSCINFKDVNNLSKNINIYTYFTDKNLKILEELKVDYLKKIKEFCAKNNYNFNQSINENFETNNHHHGGTVFGHNLDKYPVDKTNRLNGFKNMFINGSSVFPSSSIYGPTFTIMALSLRLADNIKKLYIN